MFQADRVLPTRINLKYNGHYFRVDATEEKIDKIVSCVAAGCKFYPLIKKLKTIQSIKSQTRIGSKLKPVWLDGLQFQTDGIRDGDTFIFNDSERADAGWNRCRRVS